MNLKKIHFKFILFLLIIIFFIIYYKLNNSFSYSKNEDAKKLMEMSLRELKIAKTLQNEFLNNNKTAYCDHIKNGIKYFDKIDIRGVDPKQRDEFEIVKYDVEKMKFLYKKACNS
jgi:hypothetical protein